MAEETPAGTTLALSTKVEELFVSPLTAIRGALEILRDFPDLDAEESRKFVETALRECGRLEQGIDELADAVYEAARRAEDTPSEPKEAAPATAHGDRIKLFDDLEIMELDFSEFAFTSAQTVNAFFDEIDAAIKASGRKWYFLVDHRATSVWPEAWVAYAHRAKKVSVNHALGTIRYDASGACDAGMETSREAALERVAEHRKAQSRRRA